MSYPRLAQWKVELLRRMAAAGCTQAQMARALRVSRQRIWQLCRRRPYGIVPRHSFPQRRGRPLKQPVVVRDIAAITAAKRAYWEGAA